MTCDNYDPNVGDYRIERLARNGSGFEGMAVEKDTLIESAKWILTLGDRERTYRITRYNMSGGIAQEVLRFIPSILGWVVELNERLDYDLIFKG